jgi:hypothetical protein
MNSAEIQGQFARLYLEGGDGAGAAVALGLSARTAARWMRRIESVCILGAHGVPARWIAKVCRIPPEEVAMCLRAIEHRFVDRGETVEFVEAREACAAGHPEKAPGANEGEGSSPACEGDVRPLDVLEFWTSRWL